MLLKIIRIIFFGVCLLGLIIIIDIVCAIVITNSYDFINDGLSAQEKIKKEIDQDNLIRKMHEPEERLAKEKRIAEFKRSYQIKHVPYLGEVVILDLEGLPSKNTDIIGEVIGVFFEVNNTDVYSCRCDIEIEHTDKKTTGIWFLNRYQKLD